MSGRSVHWQPQCRALKGGQSRKAWMMIGIFVSGMKSHT